MKNNFECYDCGYQAVSKFYSCPKCKGRNIGDVKEPEKNISYKGKEITKISYGDHFNKSMIRTIKDINDGKGNKFEIAADYSDKFPGFNGALSSNGGLVAGAVILLAASPGTGKTTLLTQCTNKDTLFISTEETEKQVTQRFMRTKSYGDAKILCTVSPEDILGAIDLSDEKIIFIDSVNSIENENGGLASYQTIADLTQRIVHLAKQRNKAIIMISQVTKNGNVIGMESVSHAVDAVIHMERSTTSDAIILSTSKNRFGEVGDIVYLHHEEDGLHEIDGMVSDENSIGTTVFEMISGSKKIPVDVQALITPAVDARPIRRAIGIDINKLYMINGILQFNDRSYNTSDMDIYIQTSNGIILPPGNDLPIINSMLSCYYQKVPITDTYKAFKGILNLNGTIIGNERFKHVSQIIDLYK